MYYSSLKLHLNLGEKNRIKHCCWFWEIMVLLSCSNINKPFFWDKVQSVSVIETAFFNSCIQCNLSSHCFLWSYILQTEHTKTTTTQHTHADCKTCECEQLNETMSARSKQYDMVVDTELMVLQHEGLTPYDPLTFSVNLTGLV